VVKGILILGRKERNIRRAKFPEISDAFANCEKFIVLDSFIGNRMVQISDFPFSFRIFAEDKSAALVSLQVHFIGWACFLKSRNLDKPEFFIKRINQFPFFAHVAGNQLVFSLTENAGDGVPADRIHFTSGAKPDDIGCKMVYERFYIHVLDIGMKDMPAKD
jgi:hypothetical protein